MRLNDVQDTRKVAANKVAANTYTEEPKYSLFNVCQKLASMFGAIMPVDVF